MVRPTKPFHSKSTHTKGDVGYEYRHTIGAWIKTKRLDAELTQVQLANLLGVRETAVSAIETGRSTIPPERYEAYANALGIAPAEFGVFVLRYDNPWLYKMVFGADGKLNADLAAIPERLGIDPFAPKSAAEVEESVEP